jgi:glucose/arabinose dehydrogenase
VAFLPDGAVLVTEREGRLRVIRDGRLVSEPVSGVPSAYVDSQGGLFDVVPAADFSATRHIYLTLARGDRAANGTVLYRCRLSEDSASLTDVEEIFAASPLKRGGAHFGGRLLQLPDGSLLLGLGDGYAMAEAAQDTANHFGKIVRIAIDGSAPVDNPRVGTPGAAKEVFSLGHRNVQGLARDPESGAIYAVEHGPKGGDELNLIKPGANYGWPVVTYGVNYDGSIVSAETHRDGMEQPLTYWVPSIATSGLLFYTGDMFPDWRGDLFVSGLAGMVVERVDLGPGSSVLGRERLFGNLEQRFRHVAQAPDGAIWLLTDGPDGQVLRVSAGGDAEAE